MKRLLRVLIGFVVLLGMQQVQAFDPEHLKRLKETNKSPYCDLQGADLQEANLQDAKLQRANLSEALLDSKGLAIAKTSGAIGLL